MDKLPPSAPIVEEDLHAFVDHALDADRRKEVQDHLDRDPEAAATVAKFAAQRQLLRSTLAADCRRICPATASSQHPTQASAQLWTLGLANGCYGGARARDGSYRWLARARCTDA